MFITYLFGKRLLPFLQIWLYSLKRNCPSVHPYVFFDGVPYTELRLLQDTYKNVTFIFHPFRILRDEHWVRVSQKPAFIKWLIQKYFGETLYVVEVDLLVLRDPQIFLVKNNGWVDWVFTYRDNPDRPVNTGVMFVRADSQSLAFANSWNDLTTEIFKDPERTYKVSQEQGGVDQWTFVNLLKHKNFQGEFTREFQGRKVNFEGVACDQINCIEKPTIDDAYMIHAKSGGPQDYLLDGTHKEYADWEVTRKFLEYWKEAQIPGSEARLHSG